MTVRVVWEPFFSSPGTIFLSRFSFSRGTGKLVYLLLKNKNPLMSSLGATKSEEIGGVKISLIPSSI